MDSYERSSNSHYNAEKKAHVNVNMKKKIRNNRRKKSFKAVISIILGLLVFIGVYVVLNLPDEEEILFVSPPGVEENSPENWKYISLNEQESVKYLNCKSYNVFTREINFNLAILDKLDNAEDPYLIPEAYFVWMPADGFVELRSNDPDRITMLTTSYYCQNFPVVEVYVKNWDINDTIKLSAIYDKVLISAEPLPEKSFPFIDRVRYDPSVYITSYDDEHPPGSDEWLDKLYGIAGKAKSFMEIVSVVSSVKESRLTGKKFTYGGMVMSSNSRDTDIIKSMEGNCISPAILVCSLLEKYDPSLEPGIVYSLVKNKNEDIAHVEVQIKTREGYIQFDPCTSANLGCLASYGAVVPLDFMNGSYELLPEEFLKKNMEKSISMTPIVSGFVNKKYYVTSLNSLEDEISYPKDS